MRNNDQLFDLLKYVLELLVSKLGKGSSVPVENTEEFAKDITDTNHQNNPKLEKLINAMDNSVK